MDLSSGVEHLARTSRADSICGQTSGGLGMTNVPSDGRERTEVCTCPARTIGCYFESGKSRTRGVCSAAEMATAAVRCRGEPNVSNDHTAYAAS